MELNGQFQTWGCSILYYFYGQGSTFAPENNNQQQAKLQIPTKLVASGDNRIIKT
jgi:hypothetical protein